MTQRTLARTSALLSDLNSLCEFGGRLSGTFSEEAARRWLAVVGAQALGVQCREHRFAYDGWRAAKATLAVDGDPLVCHPLVRSEATPEGGLEAEVVDLGRGLPADFGAKGDSLRGKIAMVDHEKMFSTGTFHRRKKIQLARRAGAAAVLVVSRAPGLPVAGSSRDEEPGLPTLGVAPDSAVRLRALQGTGRKARLTIETVEKPAEASNLLFDCPGSSGMWITLSAHYDGHDLCESALDNATSVAVCLEVARRLQSTRRFGDHGVRLAFFSVEEWGLVGSRRYLEGLTQAELDQILLNINVDTVGSSRRLTALTSGFCGLSEWVENETRRAGIDIGIHEPFQANSDHASFVRAGIPALRLLSGFDEPDSVVRHVLTANDTRDQVDPDALGHAADLTELLVRSALGSTVSKAARWRRRTQD